MPPGDIERLGTLAYVTLSDDAPMSTPAPYIRATLMEVAEHVHYRMHPSSRGHRLLHFDSKVDRDAMVDLSPIHHEAGHLTLECPKDTSNRFIIRCPWLLAVAATDFPEEH